MRFAKSLIVFISLTIATAAVVPDIAVRDDAVDHGRPHKGRPPVRLAITSDHRRPHGPRDTTDEDGKGHHKGHKGHPARSAPENGAHVHREPRDAGKSGDKGHHKGHPSIRGTAGEDTGDRELARDTSVKDMKSGHKGHHERDVAEDKKGHHNRPDTRDTVEVGEKGHKHHNARDTAKEDKGHHKGHDARDTVEHKKAHKGQ